MFAIYLADCKTTWTWDIKIRVRTVYRTVLARRAEEIREFEQDARWGLGWMARVVFESDVQGTREWQQETTQKVQVPFEESIRELLAEARVGVTVFAAWEIMTSPKGSPTKTSLKLTQVCRNERIHKRYALRLRRWTRMSGLLYTYFYFQVSMKIILAPETDSCLEAIGNYFNVCHLLTSSYDHSSSLFYRGSPQNDLNLSVLETASVKDIETTRPTLGVFKSSQFY